MDKQPNSGTVLVKAYLNEEQVRAGVAENIYKLHLKQKLPGFRNRSMSNYKIMGLDRPGAEDDRVRVVRLGDMRLPGRVPGMPEKQLQPSAVVAL